MAYVNYLYGVSQPEPVSFKRSAGPLASTSRFKDRLPTYGEISMRVLIPAAYADRGPAELLNPTDSGCDTAYRYIPEDVFFQASAR